MVGRSVFGEGLAFVFIEMLVLLERLVVFPLVIPVFVLLRLSKGFVLMILLRFLLVLMILLRFSIVLLGLWLWCLFLFLFLFIVFIIILVIIFIFINILFHIEILILFVIIILLGLPTFTLSFCGLRTSSTHISIISLSFLFILRNGFNFVRFKKSTNIHRSISLGDELDLIEQRDKQIDGSMRVLLGQYSNKHLLLVLLCPQLDRLLRRNPQDHVGDRKHLTQILICLLRRELV